MSTVMTIRINEQNEVEEKQNIEVSTLLAEELVQKEALLHAIESKGIDEEIKIRLWLGNFYLRKAKLIPTMVRMQLAEEHFSAIIKLNPHPILLAQAYLGRAEALISSGGVSKPPQGLTYLDLTLKLLEGITENTQIKLRILQSVLMLQGTTLAHMGKDDLKDLSLQPHDKENAIENLKRAAELYQNYPEILDPMASYEYGKFLYDNEKYESAIGFLSSSLGAFRRAGNISETIINNNRTYFLQATDKTQPFADVFEKLQFCVECGLELNKIENQQGLPILLEAVKTGSLKLVKLVLSSGLTRKIDADGNNALHYAAMFGHVDLLDEFLDIRIDDPNSKSETPIFLAVKNGRVKMVESLLLRGASAGDTRNNIVYEAIRAGQGCLLEELHKTKENAYTELAAICGGAGAFILHAIDSNAIPILKTLLKLHPEAINAPFQDQPLLFHAIESCRKNPNINAQLVIQALIEAGANLILNGERASRVAERLDAPASVKNYLENKIREKETAEGNFKTNTLRFHDECIRLLNTQAPKKLGPSGSEGRQKLLSIIQDLIRNDTLLIKQFQIGHYDNNLFKSLEDVLKNKATINRVETEIKKADDKKYARIKRFLEIAAENLIAPLVNDRKEIKEDSSIDSFETKQGLESSAQHLTPNMVNFCERFERQFDDAYCYFRGVASGELTSVADARVREAVRAGQVAAVEHLPSLGIPTPVGGVSAPIGGILAVAAEVALYFRQRYNRKQAERMNNIFKAVTPYERAHFVRYTAERLAFKYRVQIEHLNPGSEGVERFADCCVARVIQYIIESDKNTTLSEENQCSIMIRTAKSWLFNKEIPSELREQKSLYDTFVHGLIAVTSSFDKDFERLQTINGLTSADDWRAKGIFENTGILTDSQERYAHENVNLERYGYCLGTKEEAAKRLLSLINPKTKLPWEAGRKWVSQQSMAPLLSVEQVRGNGSEPRYSTPSLAPNPLITPLREMRAEVQSQRSRATDPTISNASPKQQRGGETPWS